MQRQTGEHLRAFRDRFSLTQNQCADWFAVSAEAVKKWEQGRNALPGPVSQWVRAAQMKPAVVRDLLMALKTA
jgi:DNA-binding transcriptional regulator YiaG